MNLRSAKFFWRAPALIFLLPALAFGAKLATSRPCRG